MKNFFVAFRQIISGTRQITTNLKFSLLMFCMFLVHLVYAAYFYAQGISPLAAYNIFAIIIYIANTFLTYHRHYRCASIITLSEIWTCSLLTARIVGWNTGFGMCLIAVVPIIFYLSFSTDTFGRKLFTPSLLSILSFIVFLASRAISLYFEPLWIMPSRYSVMIMYLFNALVAFTSDILFSVFFLLEMRNMRLALQQQNQNLDRMASTDSLTNLWNRRSMDRFLLNAVRSYEACRLEFCIILGDVDDFKHVNDTYGHGCGDAVLTHLASLIKSCVRADDYVCRWGGEEILILMQGSHSAAKLLAERIRNQIEHTPTEYEDKLIPHTMTFGVAACQEGIPIEQIIRTADAKLYQGKNNGKNQVIA